MSANPPTPGPPHVRATIDLSTLQSIQILALAPVLAVAVLNTGYQYLLALDAAGGESGWDWSDRAIYFLGVGYEDPSLWGALAAGMVHVVPVLAVAVLSAGACDRVFYTLRGVPMGRGFVVSALVFTLLMPPGTSLVHVVMGMTFAMVFGKGVFGGEGKTFLNPALLGVAVVQISFPTALVGHPLWTGVEGYAGSGIFSAYHREGAAALASAGGGWWSAVAGTTPGPMGTTSVLAVALGAGVLLWRGVVSWRLIAAQALGLITAAAAFNLVGGGMYDMPWYWHLVLGSFAFCAVFVATDPAGSASTDAGRWVQGIVMGALVVLIRTVNESHPDGAVAALLLGAVLAPLIDHAVIWFNVRSRSKRPL